MASEPCEACGLPKRTLEQVNDMLPHPGTCTTWLFVSEVGGVKFGGCQLEAYRKLIETQAKLSAYRALAEATETLSNELAGGEPILFIPCVQSDAKMAKLNQLLRAADAALAKVREVDPR